LVLIKRILFGDKAGPDPRSGLQTVRSGMHPASYINLFISWYY
jgi:hypothetical protein